MKLDRLPTVDDMSPIINAMKRGDYFVTSGEVLISTYAVEGTGDKRTITAEVEWTFPLDFVEVVWGDGQKTDRQIISTTDLPPFGKKQFQIPFNAAARSGCGSPRGTSPPTARLFSRSGSAARPRQPLTAQK